jgi:hypothetical protein
MDTPKYKLSLTAASLSLTESINIAEVYLRCKDWKLTRQAIKDNNLLQSRTNSRTIRVSREVIQRLKLLTKNQLELLVEGNLHEQKYLLWFSVCKTYGFVKEFAIEVLHEKFLTRNMKITDLDYDAFFNRKADRNERLEKLTPLTQKKIRQVVFHMMREAGLLTEENVILPAMLSKRLVEVLKPDFPISFYIFPAQLSDSPG